MCASLALETIHFSFSNRKGRRNRGSAGVEAAVVMQARLIGQRSLRMPQLRREFTIIASTVVIELPLYRRAR